MQTMLKRSKLIRVAFALFQLDEPTANREHWDALDEGKRFQYVQKAVEICDNLDHLAVVVSEVSENEQLMDQSSLTELNEDTDLGAI